MTSLLIVLLIIAAIGGSYLLARYNRNDNLFLILAISLLMGIAGGAIYQKLSSKKVEKKSDLVQVYNPTQALPANAIDFVAVLGEPSALEPNPASKDNYTPVRDNKIYGSSSESFGEIRGQPYFGPRNKGTPGMPFDTS